MADIIEKTTSSKSLEEEEKYGNKKIEQNEENELEQMPQLQQNETSVAPLPKQTEVQLMTKLAVSLSESYQLVKQRQQKYNELSSRFNDSSAAKHSTTSEWQEVANSKNKLKRKKNLSASLTSVNDSVNQEKRTRIEGIHLNCRGKLSLSDVNGPTTTTISDSVAAIATTSTLRSAEKVVTKPPLPPTCSRRARDGIRFPCGSSNQSQIAEMANISIGTKVPPPRFKRKLQENIETIQKLNALTEQLRMEINELKSNLATERSAVRVLRAQNESENRKWKNEVKKLQQSVDALKKPSPIIFGKRQHEPTGHAENLPPTLLNASSASLNHEIQRLTNEILTLKEANKAFEERKMINCDADRRKAADIRELRDSYEIRLTQLTKSAKNEISRLLEEIKTKERNIGQLKKELQQQQNKISENTKSRNATNTTTTNKSTTNKTKKSTQKQQQQQQQSQQKDKKLEKKNQNFSENHKIINENEENRSGNTNTKEINLVQNPDEMKQLKDFELINNTKNLPQNDTINSNDNSSTNSNNLIHITTKIFNISHNNKEKIQKESTNISDIKRGNNKADENNDTVNNNTHNAKNINNAAFPDTKAYFQCTLRTNNNKINAKQTTEIGNPSQTVSTQTVATTTIAAKTTTIQPHSATSSMSASLVGNDRPTEYHSLPHDLMTERFVETTHSNAHDYTRSKDNNSDSDSALSSAPPSISPQPPPNGMETSDIWQTIRNYTTDVEKLQNELDVLQKENAELRQELNIAKEQILEFERTALIAANNSKLQQLMERIHYLEEQERNLQAESDELREQNELLEFRILELEESNDKWSPTNPATSFKSNSAASIKSGVAKDVWSCGEDVSIAALHPDKSNDYPISEPLLDIPLPLLDEKIEQRLNNISPCELNLIDQLSSDELRRILAGMLQRYAMKENEVQCVHQILTLLQNLDAISHRSGPNSLNTNSSEEPSSLDLAKSRISDYSSASSSSSSYASSSVSTVSSAPTPETNSKSKSSAHISSTCATATNSRIVATVQPYNSSVAHPHLHLPSSNPADQSPRKARTAWQNNSLSESGVFVESDFFSDSSENNVCTQTDFDETAQLNPVNGNAAAKELLFNELQKLQQQQQQPTVTTAFLSSSLRTPSATAAALSDLKRLQYYKDRLELLESKLLIYESSGDLQVKRLADRLQREIELEKEVKDLRERVDYLKEQNAILEEEKCEFEEAENDTRLRLQRLEVEQEILSQRNIELEMSREALSAKYKDCRSECLILRDDLGVSETQIRHLEEDKLKIKESLEFLHSTLPLFMLYGAFVAEQKYQTQCPQKIQGNQVQNNQPQRGITEIKTVPKGEMGNSLPPVPLPPGGATIPTEYNDFLPYGNRNQSNPNDCDCAQHEVDYLKEEIKCLRHQINELNSRHYEALESADSHWVDLEKEYKDREESFRAKEACLKQKINRLQDCLRDDARAANEKITQLEDAERDLKACLLRMSKEHRDLCKEHQSMLAECQNNKEQYEKLKEQQQPLRDSLDQEKKSNKALTDELNFMRKLQAETESRNMQEMETLRNQLFEVKKEFLHVEVTNSELKEEVTTLEQQIGALQKSAKDNEDKIRVLTDEVRSKEEMCAKLEKQLQRSDGYSLAEELDGSPSKRFKKEDVKDLKTASQGLGNALRNMKEYNLKIPTHQKFTNVARDVKKLADTLLGVNAPSEDIDELLQQIENQINEQLMDFHSKKMESEFYCTVYYPVKRRIPKHPKEIT